MLFRANLHHLQNLLLGPEAIDVPDISEGESKHLYIRNILQDDRNAFRGSKPWKLHWSSAIDHDSEEWRISIPDDDLAPEPAEI